nr:hypothetical protein [Tanacetum cinerariifolium]
MPILGSLITANIQEASYYQEYLAKVAKHQRYLAGETGSDPDSPAPKPPKIARKRKPTMPKAHPWPSVSKQATSIQPEPKSAPSKTQGKKRKPTTEVSNKPSKAIKTRPDLVTKKCKPISSLRSEDKSVAEEVPAKEPQVDEEEADVQRALEESLKSMYDVPQGSLLPIVIREPERTSTPTGSSGLDESSLLYVELGLTDNEVDSEEDVPGADARGQGEGQAEPDPGAQAEGQTGQDEGQAGSNPDEQPEGQARPGPGNARADEQPMPSPMVHAGSDRTLSSLQHLTKDLSFGDLFFSNKPSEADNDKATAETKAESMVSVTIQQDMSLIPPMTTPIIDLTSRPESPNVHQLLKATATKTTTTTTTSLPLPYQQQQSTAEAMMMKRIGELERIMANLIQ